MDPLDAVDKKLPKTLSLDIGSVHSHLGLARWSQYRGQSDVWNTEPPSAAPRRLRSDLKLHGSRIGSCPFCLCRRMLVPPEGSAECKAHHRTSQQTGKVPSANISNGIPDPSCGSNQGADGTPALPAKAAERVRARSCTCGMLASP